MKGTAENVMNQKGEFLGPLMRVVLPLMKNVLTPKSIMIPFRLMVTLSATNAAIQKNMWIRHD